MKSSRRYLFLLGSLPVIFLLAFYILPLGTIFEKAISGLQTTDLQPDLLKRIADPLQFTFIQAILSTILTILVGFPIAYVFSHYTFPAKRFFQTAVTLPFILPTVVVAAAFNSLVGEKGWLNILFVRLFDLGAPPIQLSNTLWIILIAHVFYNTSVFVRIVGAAWGQLDMRQEEAASVLGANPWKRFWRITFPLLRPAIISALLMVFLFDFTSFGVILLLGGPGFETMEVEIYLQTTQLLNLPMAGILSIIQLLIVFVISLLTLDDSRGKLITFLPDIKNERIKKPEKSYQKLIVVLILVLIVILFILPELSLLLRSIVKLEADRGELGQIQTGFTLDFYRELFKNPRRSLFYVPPIEALGNSIAFAASTTLIALLVGTAAAYLLVFVKNKRLMRALIILPLGTSSVTLGLGFLITYTRLPVFRSVPQLLIPIAHALVALPVVINTMYPAFASIPQSIRDAAANLGATPQQVLRLIDLPLIRRAITVAALYAFIVSLGEFGATAFLTRPEVPTIPIAIYRFLGLPGALNYGQAMAMSCILLVVSALSMLTIERLIAKDQDHV